MAIENGPFINDLPIKKVIFRSYVSLPEGRPADVTVGAPPQWADFSNKNTGWRRNRTTLLKPGLL